jgi:hypothetical protein
MCQMYYSLQVRRVSSPSLRIPASSQLTDLLPVNSIMQGTPTSLASAQTLTHELLRGWFREETVGLESRAAAASALDV